MTIETLLTEKNANRTLYVMNMDGKASIRIVSDMWLTI
jgi:hypothetical protein